MSQATQTAIDIIVRAQALLMDQHDVTSETALGLLVWAATDRDTTVVDVARSICSQSLVVGGIDPGLHATA